MAGAARAIGFESRALDAFAEQDLGTFSGAVDVKAGGFIVLEEVVAGVAALEGIFC